MTRAILIAAIATLLLCGCAEIAEVQQGDENRVYVVHGEYTAPVIIALVAKRHCAKYGKTAVLQFRYTQDTDVFRCQ